MGTSIRGAALLVAGQIGGAVTGRAGSVTTTLQPRCVAGIEVVGLVGRDDTVACGGGDRRAEVGADGDVALG